MIFTLGPEALASLIVLLVAFGFDGVGMGWFRGVERAWDAVARRRVLSVILCGVAALALRAALLPILPIPVAYVPDEFSFLLMADTFAHGRLTNPAHPMWMHFESFHINMQPTYASMYPPMQGFFLAAGQVLAGHPFWGVWLSVGLMCAAICWMLQAWLPARWALLGGLIPVMRFGVFYWGDSYWGGAPAAIGGALVLGALPRIFRRQRVSDSIVMALGLGMLANSRPWEGFLLALPVSVALLVWMISKKRPPTKVFLGRVVAPMASLLLVFAIAMGYYFWRVTGSPFRMPYQVNRDTYSIARYFYGQSPNFAPVYHQAVLRDFYLAEYQRYKESRTLSGFLVEAGRGLFLTWAFYIGPALTIFLFALPRAARDRRIRFLVLTGAFAAVAMATVIFYMPNYAAPFTALFLAIILQSLRHLRLWRPKRRPVGLFLERATVLACVVMVPFQASALYARGAGSRESGFRRNIELMLGSSRGTGTDRGGIASWLNSRSRGQLVLVREKPGDSWTGSEWVYNAADIDGSKIVWAWDMGSERNEELLRYYRDRTAWLLIVNDISLKLLPYADVTKSSESATATP